MKIQELFYSRPSLIGSVSIFRCMLQFRIFCFLSPTYVCIQSRQKVKLSSANVHSLLSRARKRERECYNYTRVQFSVGLCQWVHICAHVYVLVCVCVGQGVPICVTVSMCRQGSGGQLCACVQKALDALQTPAGNCSGPCPVQKTARASHLQAKWPYPEDIKRHLGQQQHEHQGDETGYQHVHRAWLSSEQAVQGIFRFILVLTFFR